MYLVNCKVCGIQNVGSTKNKYRKRLNNYKTVQRNVREKKSGEGTEKEGETNSRESIFKKKVKFKKDHKEKKYCQEKFHQHFCEAGHKGIEDWEIILIDSAHTEKSLRSKELFWQYKLRTFFPEGLNEVEASVEIS